MPRNPHDPGHRRRLRLSAPAYRSITLASLAAVCVIIVTGAAVRLTGSGLGCPDWPACEPGTFIEVRPTDYHAMIESVNRLVTGLVSLSVMVATLGSIIRRPFRRDLLYLSLGLVGGILGQIVLGGLVVKFGLLPPFVMGHFLVSLLIVWNAVVLHDRAGRPDGPDGTAVGRDPSGSDSVAVRLARALFVVAGAVVFTGTIVTATGPHAGDIDAERFRLALPDVTRVHGGFVVLLLLLTIAELWRLARVSAPDEQRRAARWLLGFLAVQAGIGYTQYFTDVPALLVGFHIAGAVAVWISVIRLNIVSPRPRPLEVVPAPASPLRLRDESLAPGSHSLAE